MDYFLYFILFCIGTLFGSFFTLAVYRIPLGKNITHERSFCPNCNHKLSFFDMIPILSYLFLGGKCRYCHKKIRPRYLLLEILSGLIFVLFAMSIKLSIFTINMSQIMYLLFGFLYLATLFIIAGIDKEKTQIQTSVLLFGYIAQILYIIYLYIVEKEPNMYRYVIYLAFICILLLVHTFLLRKKGRNSYPVATLLLSMLMVMFGNEIVFIFTVIITLVAIAIRIILAKIVKDKNLKQQAQLIKLNLPIGFYLCAANIICLLVINFYTFHQI